MTEEGPSQAFALTLQKFQMSESIDSEHDTHPSQPSKPQVNQSFKNAGFISRNFLSFAWRMIKSVNNNHREMTEEFMEDMNLIDDETEKTFGRFINSYDGILQRQQNEHKELDHKSAMVRALLHTGKRDLIVSVLLSFFSDSLGLFVSYFIGQIIAFINDKEATLGQGVYVILIFILAVLFNSVLKSNYIFRSQVAILKVRKLVIQILYNKIGRLSMKSLIETNSGKIITLVSSDFIQVEKMLPQIVYIITAPLLNFMAFLFIGFSIGFEYSTMAVGFWMIQLIGQHYIGNQVRNTKMKESIIKETLMKLTNDVIIGARTIKCYAWEMHYKQKIEKERKKQMVQLRFLNIYQQLGTSLFNYGGMIVSVCIFITMYCRGQSFKGSNVFSVMAILNTIFTSINQQVYGAIMVSKNIQAIFSRMAEVLEMEEFKPKQIEDRKNNSQGDDSPYILIKKGEYSYGFRICDTIEVATPKSTRKRKNQVADSYKLNLESDKDLALRDINIDIHESGLLVVVGAVGCGKTTLLLSLMNETKLCSKDHIVSGSIAYVEQEPFIMSGTIRENILFGLPFNKAKFNEAVLHSELTTDLVNFQDGAFTQIGDRGINISGGQKARISLARALYSDADIYLLDDPLSAVDPEVAHNLFNLCINGFLSNKIRILVTHQLQFLRECKQILILENGVQVKMGSYQELVDFGFNIQQLTQVYIKQKTIQRTKTKAQQSLEDQVHQMEEKRSKAMLRGFTASFDCETPSKVGGMNFKSPKAIMRRKAQTVEYFQPLLEESHSLILDSVNEVDEEYDEYKEDDTEEQKQQSNPSSCLDLQKNTLQNMKSKLSTQVRLKESSGLTLTDNNSQFVDFYNVNDIDDKSEEEINEVSDEDEDESVDASVSYSFHDSTTKSKRKQVNLSFVHINSAQKFTNSLKNSVIKQVTATNNEVIAQEDFEERDEDEHNPSNEHLETQRQSQIGKEDLEKNQTTKHTQAQTHTTDRITQIQNEEMEEQTVRIKDYYSLLAEAWGVPGIVLLFIFYLSTTVLQLGPSYFLSEWVTLENTNTTTTNTTTNITSSAEAVVGSTYPILFSLSTILFVVMVIFRGVFNFNMILNSSSKLYQKMIQSTLTASIKFFDTNPIGQIVTRFSKDVTVCDTQIGNLFVFTAGGALRIGGIIITLAVVNYYIIIPILVTFVFLFVIKRIGSPVLVQSQGFDSKYRGPLHSNLMTLINGLITFRCYDRVPFYKESFVDSLEKSANASFCYIIAQSWIRVRLDLSSIIIITSTAIFCVSFKSIISASLLAYSLQIITDMVQTFTLTIRIQAELQNTMVCSKRMQSYTHLEQEDDLVKPTDEARKSLQWPMKGEITFTNVTMRYQPELDPALKSVSFTASPGMKIGIVGRTGSGKSSVLQALFRLVNLESGKIEIDSVNIKDVGLHLLRQNIGFIPQMPFLLQGTLYENLDPFNEHTLEEVEKVLNEVQLLRYIKTFKKGIMSEVKETNSMFSVGQKQLICLARAILRSTKILVLDEATANIDLETDNMIQKKLREHFKDNTVLIIAHRLATVIDADRILVMHEGKALEFDYPFKLLANLDTDEKVTRRDGFLSKMVLSNGEKNAQQLFDAAKEKYKSRAK